VRAYSDWVFANVPPRTASESTVPAKARALRNDGTVALNTDVAPTVSPLSGLATASSATVAGAGDARIRRIAG
jgi:hypothetical protein